MLPLQLNRPRARLSQRGFSMIEVLVTLLIIALALLGTAGLQAYSMRLNQGGQFRSQAVFLAADLAERMEANRPGAVAGAYANPQASTLTACLDAVCTQTALADFDVLQWQTAVAATLPQGTTNIVQTATGNPSIYRITISWVDRRADTTRAAYDAGAALGSDASGTGERFFYTSERTIFN